MKTYNFKARFADAVEHDRKCNTIRARGKRQPPVVGEYIRRYTGMRTKKCRWLGDRICRLVAPLRINRKGEIYISNAKVGSLDRVILAVADGFDSVKGFIDFFRAEHGLPFRGHFIAWHPKAHTPCLRGFPPPPISNGRKNKHVKQFKTQITGAPVSRRTRPLGNFNRNEPPTNP
jgi:hypothetical protein